MPPKKRRNSASAAVHATDTTKSAATAATSTSSVDGSSSSSASPSSGHPHQHLALERHQCHSHAGTHLHATMSPIPRSRSEQHFRMSDAGITSIAVPPASLNVAPGGGGLYESPRLSYNASSLSGVHGARGPLTLLQLQEDEAPSTAAVFASIARGDGGAAQSPTFGARPQPASPLAGAGGVASAATTASNSVAPNVYDSADAAEDGLCFLPNVAPVNFKRISVSNSVSTATGKAVPVANDGGGGGRALPANPSDTMVVQELLQAMCLRRKWVYTPRPDRTHHEYERGHDPKIPMPSMATPLPPKSAHHFKCVRGVFFVYEGEGENDTDYQSSTPRTTEPATAAADGDKSARKRQRTGTDGSSSFPSSSSSSLSSADHESKEVPQPATSKLLFSIHNVDAYFQDLKRLHILCADGPAMSFCKARLQISEARFKLHKLLNGARELTQLRRVPHRDFYNVRKIDNHVHHSACMNQKHLLRFIKSKLKENSPEIVIHRDGADLTLAEVFKSLNVTPYDLNVDTLDCHAQHTTFRRFDRFNQKYNPVGESRLREIFLKYDNLIKGRYLAEITKQVFDDLESNKYQFAEYRLSIYGRKRSEWDTIGAWVVDNNLFSPWNCWMIQIPRLYAVYKSMSIIDNFQQMLSNIFVPLFEVSIDPSTHPKLHVFLQNVVAFDSVDDESKREFFLRPSIPDPADWTGDQSPPYALFNYYLAANIHVLNQLRASRGMNTFAYRPHAGEVGDVEHLISSYLLATGINHGIELVKSPALQYLFYLSQTGISMSPLSNNLLFLEYDRNPFPLFFARGLNVTLSTDDPLMIHVTKEPLVEEYSVAAQVWKLTSIDMCEAARNSVLQSGFAHRLKAHWLGPRYFRRHVSGNDTHQTNVPDIRVQFRLEMHQEEFAFLNDHLKDSEVAVLAPSPASSAGGDPSSPVGSTPLLSPGATTMHNRGELQWQKWRTAETAECFSHALMDPL